MSAVANAALLVLGLAALAVAAVAWRNRPTGGASYLAGFALAVAVWSLAHLLEHLTTGATATAFAKLMWVGIAPAAFLFVAAVLEYVGWGDVLTRPVRVALFCWPTALVVLLWVPEGTPLSVWPQLQGETGLVYWGHVGVSYALLALGSVLLGAHVAAASVPFRSQGLALLVGIGAAWAGSVVSVFELFGDLHVHALPAGFLVLAGCLLWGITRTDLLAVAPVAERAVVDRLSAGVAVVDSNGRVTRLNPAAARLLGLADDTDGGDDAGHVRAVGSEVADVFERYPDLVDWIETADRTDRKAKIHTDDDTALEVELSPLRDGRDRFVGWVLLLYDVTERRAHEQELERQNERLERFASIVSHDLRNPLNVAMGRLELARGGEDVDEDHLDAVARSHERMAELIEDLLAISRQDEEDLDRQPATLGALARQSWATVDTADADLTVADDPSIEVDPHRFQQLLENLFRNAVEHGGEDVTVTVGALPDADGFYVADDGAGFDTDADSDLDAVFESGYSTDERGTGLGLTVVDEVASAHGWDVEATESGAGGARFEVTGVDLT